MDERLKPTDSKVWHLQNNTHSEDETWHEVIWTDMDDSQTSSKETGSGPGTGFVRLLRPGDSIAVIAKARVSVTF